MLRRLSLSRWMATQSTRAVSTDMGHGLLAVQQRLADAELPERRGEGKKRDSYILTGTRRSGELVLRFG